MFQFSEDTMRIETFWVLRIGNTIVSAHTAASPTNEQWEHYLLVAKKMIDQIGFSALRGIVFSDGGAPTSSQRERLNIFLEGRSARTAIVSGSQIVRGVVTALGWFNPQIKTFSPSRVREALAHIGFAESSVPSLCDQIRPMAGSVEAVRRALEELEVPLRR
jgi:hypothetical protein